MRNGGHGFLNLKQRGFLDVGADQHCNIDEPARVETCGVGVPMDMHLYPQNAQSWHSQICCKFGAQEVPADAAPASDDEKGDVGMLGAFEVHGNISDDEGSGS